MQTLFNKVFLQFLHLKEKNVLNRVVSFSTAMSTIFAVTLRYKISLDFHVKCKCSKKLQFCANQTRNILLQTSYQHCCHRVTASSKLNSLNSMPKHKTTFN